VSSTHSPRTPLRIGGKNLFKASSKAFKAAELLPAAPGLCKDLQALKTDLSIARTSSKQEFAYKA